VSPIDVVLDSFQFENVLDAGHGSCPPFCDNGSG
jgi:hypothetical protein